MSDGHLTRETLERLSRNELSGRELIDARRHLEVCEECSAVTETTAPRARWGVLAVGAAVAIVAVLSLVGVQRC